MEKGRPLRLVTGAWGAEGSTPSMHQVRLRARLGVPLGQASLLFSTLPVGTAFRPPPGQSPASGFPAPGSHLRVNGSASGEKVWVATGAGSEPHGTSAFRRSCEPAGYDVGGTVPTRLGHEFERTEEPV